MGFGRRQDRRVDRREDRGPGGQADGGDHRYQMRQKILAVAAVIDMTAHSGR